MLWLDRVVYADFILRRPRSQNSRMICDSGLRSSQALSRSDSSSSGLKQNTMRFVNCSFLLSVKMTPFNSIVAYWISSAETGLIVPVRFEAHWSTDAVSVLISASWVLICVRLHVRLAFQTNQTPSVSCGSSVPQHIGRSVSCLYCWAGSIGDSIVILYETMTLWEY